MKKIFTLAAAMLASLTMMAVVPTGTLNPADVPAEGWAGKYSPAYIENGEWVCFSPYEIYQSTQTWAAKDNSGSTDGSWDATAPFPAQSAWTKNDGKVATVRQGQKGPYYYRITNTTEVAALVKSGSNTKRTIFLEAFELNAGVAGETATKSASMESSTMGVISVTELDATKEYLIVVRAEDSGSGGTSGGNSNFYAVGFKTIISTDPKLSVTPDSIGLKATVANPNPSAKVTFSGKNLTPGTYNLVLPSVMGNWTVNPTSVTVGEDGKLSAEITASYLLNEFVEDEKSSISLTINGITKNVVLYATSEAQKKYISSINIEQLVLDNGTKYNITGAFDAANIEYNNIDVLDSLNDGKDNRNYPFLGLKLKKTDAKLSGWLKSGSTIKVRFGNVGTNFKVTAAGIDSTCTADNFANATVESDKVLSLTAPEDMYVEIICNSTKTLVVKQIMVDSAIAPVVLPSKPEPTKYTVTCAAAENGTVTINGETSAEFEADATVTLTVTPNANYEIDVVKINDDVLAAVENVYSFKMPAKNVTVTATFKAKETPQPTKYTVTCAAAENGTVTINGETSAEFEADATVTLTVTPNANYEIDVVKVNNEVLAAVENVYSFKMPAENVTVTATFKAKETPQPTKYTVTCAAAENGTVTINGETSAEFEAGATVTLTVTPAEGYKIAQVTAGNEVLVPVNNVYSFEMPAQDVTVAATFVDASEGFEDINASEKAVKRMINGVLVIEKNGKFYNAQGAEIK